MLVDQFNTRSLYIERFVDRHGRQIPRFSIYREPPLTKGGPGTFVVRDKRNGGMVVGACTDIRDAARICLLLSMPADVAMQTLGISRQLELRPL